MKLRPKLERLQSIAVAALVSLGATASCEPSTSSSTHWLTCEVVADCSVAGAVACEDGYCVDTDGHRVSSSATPSIGGGAGAAPTTGGNPPSQAGASQNSGGSVAASVGGADIAGGPTSTSSAGSGQAGSSRGAAGSAGSSLGSAGASSVSANGTSVGGASSTGGLTGAGGDDCGCLKGAAAPVCGTDGKNYDAVCGDSCVPVPIQCRGQCPCGSGVGGAGGAGGAAGASGHTAVAAGSNGVCNSGCNVETTDPADCGTGQVGLICLGPEVDNLLSIMATNDCTNTPTNAIRYCCPSQILEQCQ